jgi:predicted TIM-barrel fold metal-dependent hydrolase
MTDLFDINAYTGDWPFRRLAHRTADDLLRLMDRAGIARAVVSPLAAVFRLDVSGPNEELLRFVEGHRDRLAPAFAVNPGDPAWEDDLRASLQAGAAALRFYPNYHAYSPADPACIEVAQAAAEAGMPLLIAARLQDERSHHPMMKVPPVGADELVELALAVPRARIVVTMLRVGEAKPLAGARNLHFDLCGMQGPVGFLPQLVEAVGAERLLLGTAMPLQYPLASVEKLRAAHLAPEARAAIAFGNAVRVLPHAFATGG